MRVDEAGQQQMRPVVDPSCALAGLFFDIAISAAATILPSRISRPPSPRSARRHGHRWFRAGAGRTACDHAEGTKPCSVSRAFVPSPPAAHVPCPDICETLAGGCGVAAAGLQIDLAGVLGDVGVGVQHHALGAW